MAAGGLDIFQWPKHSENDPLKVNKLYINLKLTLKSAKFLKIHLEM